MSTWIPNTDGLSTAFGGSMRPPVAIAWMAVTALFFVPVRGVGTTACTGNSSLTPELKCLCNAGFYSVNSTVTSGNDCIQCPSNWACYGGSDIVPCPLNSTSTKGNDMISKCQCDARFERSGIGRRMRCSFLPDVATFTPSSAHAFAQSLSIALLVVLFFAVGVQLSASIMVSCGYRISKAMFGHAGPLMLIDQIQFLTVLGNIGGVGLAPETLQKFSGVFAWSKYDFPGVIDFDIIPPSSLEMTAMCQPSKGNELLQRFVIIASAMIVVALARYVTANVIERLWGKHGYKRLYYPKWEGPVLSSCYFGICDGISSALGQLDGQWCLGWTLIGWFLLVLGPATYGIYAFVRIRGLIIRQLIAFRGEPPVRFGRMLKEVRSLETLKDRIALLRAYWKSHKTRGGWRKDSPASHRWAFLIAPLHEAAWPFFGFMFFKKMFLTVPLYMSTSEANAALAIVACCLQALVVILLVPFQKVSDNVRAIFLSFLEVLAVVFASLPIWNKLETHVSVASSIVISSLAACIAALIVLTHSIFVLLRMFAATWEPPPPAKSASTSSNTPTRSRTPLTKTPESITPSAKGYLKPPPMGATDSWEHNGSKLRKEGPPTTTSYDSYTDQGGKSGSTDSVSAVARTSSATSIRYLMSSQLENKKVSASAALSLPRAPSSAAQEEVSAMPPKLKRRAMEDNQTAGSSDAETPRKGGARTSVDDARDHLHRLGLGQILDEDDKDATKRAPSMVQPLPPRRSSTTQVDVREQAALGGGVEEGGKDAQGLLGMLDMYGGQVGTPRGMPGTGMKNMHAVWRALGEGTAARAGESMGGGKSKSLEVIESKGMSPESKPNAIAVKSRHPPLSSSFDMLPRVDGVALSVTTPRSYVAPAINMTPRKAPDSATHSTASHKQQQQQRQPDAIRNPEGPPESVVRATKSPINPINVRDVVNKAMPDDDDDDEYDEDETETLTKHANGSLDFSPVGVTHPQQDEEESRGKKKVIIYA